jgi:hypothetical protein
MAVPRGSSPAALEFLDVEPPADQARGQARVLALAADGDRQVVGGDLEQDAVVLFVENDLARHGRLERLDDHFPRIGEDT